MNILRLTVTGCAQAKIEKRICSGANIISPSCGTTTSIGHFTPHPDSYKNKTSQGGGDKVVKKKKRRLRDLTHKEHKVNAIRDFHPIFIHEVYFQHRLGTTFFIRTRMFLTAISSVTTPPGRRFCGT